MGKTAANQGEVSFVQPPRRARRASLRVLAVFSICLMLGLPGPATQAAAFPTGNTVSLFYNEITDTNSSWTAVSGDNIAINFFGQPAVNDYPIGFRLPVDALASEVALDIEATPGYKWFESYFKSQGDFNAVGHIHNNTFSQFDLRYSLVGASPFALPNPGSMLDVVAATGAASGVAVGDFNNDTLLDIAILTPAAVVVHYKGPSNYTQNVSFPITGSPVEVAASDLNGDGLTDLVAATRTLTSRLQVYPIVQTAAGTLRSEGAQVVMTGATQMPQDMVVGDLSGDGRPEVAFLFSNRTVYWAEQFGGKNLDTWFANQYSVARTSGNFGPRLNALDVSPPNCSSVVAAGQLNGSINILIQGTLNTFATLTNHTQVNDIEYAKDCTYLASVGQAGVLSIWVASTNTLAGGARAHNGAAFAVAVAPNGSRVATGGTDAQLKVWNISTLPSPIQLEFNVTETNGSILALEYSPDGSTLAVGTSNGSVNLYETGGFTLIGTLTGHNETIRRLAFHPAGTVLASGSADDTVRLWDVANQTELLNYTDATGDVTQLSFSPNGTFLASGSADGFLRVYRTDTWQLVDSINRSQPLYGLGWGPQSETIYGAAGATGTPSNVRAWDKGRLIPIAGWQTRQEFSVVSTQYGPGDGIVASASEDGTVVIVNTTTGARVATLLSHSGTANAVSFTASGSLLASSGADGIVQVYSTSTWAHVTNLSLAGNLTSVKFSPDGQLVAAGSSTGNVSLWWTANWSQARLFNASNQTVASLAFDPTSTQLVVGIGAAVNGTVRVFDALSGTLTRTLYNMTYAARAVDWSPDGATLAAGGNGQQLFLWNATTGALLTNYAAHTNNVTAVAFSPDSLKVATGGFDRNVYTWSVATGLLVQQISSLPASSNEVRSVDWSSDGTRLVVGWNDYRFPVSRSASIGGSLSTYGMAIGDVDYNYLGNELVFIQSNNGNGAVQIMPFSGGDPVLPTYSTGTQSNFASGVRVAVGDLDGDGQRDDIAVAGAAGNSVVAFQQHNASSTWNQVTSTLFLSSGVTSMTIDDVSDDGYDDILITASDPTGSPAVYQLFVLVFDPSVTQFSNTHYQTISRFNVPAATNSPSFVATGDMDGDGLTDAVTSNGAANNAYIFHQKDELFGSYISPPLFNPALSGLSIVQAYIEYDDSQSPPSTTLAFYVSVNNGLTWKSATRNQTINFLPGEGTQLRFRVDFYSDRAGVTPSVQQFWAHYLVESFPLDPRIDLGNDAIVDWNVSGTVGSKTRITMSGGVANRYIRDHQYLWDGNGTVEIPFTVRWQRPGGFNFTNLSVPYNLRPPAPFLLSPASGGYAPAQPEFVVTAFDPDGEPLKYHIQVSLSEDFSSVVAEYNQNISNVDWSCFVCLPGVNAGKFLDDADRLESGKKYYWRAEVWDGQQWSPWSLVSNFTVDDQPPEGFASSPDYSTVLQFTVTWSAEDAVNGSGLAARPYDVQYKDGLNGTWTDWFTGTNLTSAIFADASNGHRYCFRMRSADAAGNQQIYLTAVGGDTCTVVDTDRPTATIDPLAEYQQNAAFVVSWSGDDGANGSGIAGFDVEYKENNGSWVKGPQGFPGTEWTFVAKNDSEYCFRVAPRDRAGNIGSPTTPVCTQVDTSPPLGSVIIPDTTENLTVIQVSWAFTDPQTGVQRYEYCVGTAAGACDVLAPTPTPSPLSRITGVNLANDGTYWVSVRAQNGAGAWSQWTPSNPMHVEIPGPVSTFSYPDGIWTTLNVTLSIEITDPLGFELVAGDLQFRRAAFRDNEIQPWDDWRTVPVSPGPMDYLFEPLQRGYAYEFKYRARNIVGSWGAFDGTGTLIVNQLPVAATGGDRTVAIGETISLDASETLDYDGARDTLTFTWVSDDGRTINGPTGSISFDTPGVHRIQLLVNDTHETAVAEIFVFVPAPEAKRVLPGFEGALAVAGLVAVAAVAAGRSGRRRR